MINLSMGKGSDDDEDNVNYMNGWLMHLTLTYWGSCMWNELLEELEKWVEVCDLSWTLAIVGALVWFIKKVIN